MTSSIRDLFPRRFSPPARVTYNDLHIILRGMKSVLFFKRGIHCGYDRGLELKHGFENFGIQKMRTKMRNSHQWARMKKRPCSDDHQHMNFPRVLGKYISVCGGEGREIQCCRWARFVTVILRMLIIDIRRGTMGWCSSTWNGVSVSPKP